MGIYLNDHLAGATAGVELVRRISASNRGTRWSTDLERLRAEIEADRATLGEVMEELDVDRSPIKVAGGWSVEKLGRLKPNGQLRGYSPLSRVIELEMLQVGIAGKVGLWGTLRRTTGPRLPRFDLRDLISRAHLQRDLVQQIQLEAAELAFTER